MAPQYLLQTLAQRFSMIRKAASPRQAPPCWGRPSRTLRPLLGARVGPGPPQVTLRVPGLAMPSARLGPVGLRLEEPRPLPAPVAVGLVVDAKTSLLKTEGPVWS